MPRISQARRDERRTGFLEAAWRCASRMGYRDMTVDDVCAEAGLSKGAFYGYFESKQHLLLSLLDEETGAVDQLLAELGRTSMPCTERLRRFALAMLEQGEDPARVQVRVDLWNAMTTTPSVRERLAAATERRRAVLRGWIEEGVASGEVVDVPANALASLVLAVGDGLLLHSALQPTAFRWANVRRAIDVLIGGLTSPSRSGT